MSKRDYYEVLGISRSSSPEEIKKSYRKLALQYHPDRNPGDTSAEEKFKEAAEAYEILSDQGKRQRYDQFGHAGVSGPGGSQGFSNVDDIFEHFGSIFEDLFGFGGMSGKKRGSGNRARKGADLRYDLQITFREAVLGAEHKIQISKHVQCGSCSGSGAAPGSKPTVCPTCRGHGQVAIQQGFFSYATQCPDCNGLGKKIAEKCPECRGTGIKEKSSSINVKIPAGIDSGMRLRVGGEGESGANGGPAGDLYVFIEVQEDPKFRREEFDLIYSLKIGIAQAILGTELTIDCFEPEMRKIEIPAGVQPNQRLIIHGAGIPKLEKYGKGKGNLIIEVQIEIPTKLSKEAEEHLRAFALKHGEFVKGQGQSGFFERIFG